MSGLSSKKGLCFGLFLAGAGMMNVAMFLHPMSPEDFLDLALSNPLQTLAELQGGGAAALFWAGTLIAIAGLAGLAARMVAVLCRSSHLASPQRLPAH